MRPISGILHFNHRLSRWFDQLLPAALSVEATGDFRDRVAPAWIEPGSHVYDVGGGKRPLIAPGLKRARQLRVTGVDISPDELAQAPEGMFDAAVCADICAYRGSGDGDVAVCASVLEHVRDTDAALAGLLSLLRPGGVAVVFVPSRYALYAIVNRLLPERTKRWLLDRLVPDAGTACGFVARYHRCTLPDMRRALARAGATVVAEHRYYWSGYLVRAAPAHVLWRCVALPIALLGGDRFLEYFAIVARRGNSPH